MSLSTNFAQALDNTLDLASLSDAALDSVALEIEDAGFGLRAEQGAYTPAEFVEELEPLVAAAQRVQAAQHARRFNGCTADFLFRCGESLTYLINLGPQGAEPFIAERAEVAVAYNAARFAEAGTDLLPVDEKMITALSWICA